MKTRCLPLTISTFVAVMAMIVMGLPSLADEEPRHGGVLTFAVTNEPNTRDCHAADGYSSIYALAPHYSTLLRFDPPHFPQIVGDLADSWEIRDDGRTYVFHLHPGIRFHDDSLLTSEDVKVSFDRIRRPPSGVTSVRQSQYADIVGIDTPDAATAVFRIAKPDPAFLTLLASPWNCIYSAKLLRENPDYPAKIVMGSGPFRFVEQVAGSKWVGRRFENYFQPGLPYLDGFEYYVVSRPTYTTALIGGQVMAAFSGISYDEKETLARAMGDRIKFEEGARLSNFQIVFNTEHKPFDDVRVRRALSMAIDRWSAISILRRMTGAGMIGGIVRPGSAMARTAEQLQNLPGFSRDTATARTEAGRLLKEAGHEDLTFTLTGDANADPYIPIGVYVIDQWRQIGVTATQTPLPPPAWNSSRFSGNFDAILDFVGEYADDPSLWLGHYLSRDRSPENISRAIDRTLDDLYDRQRRASDPTERARLVQQFEERVIREAYVAPMTWGYRLVPLASKVMGYVATPSMHVNQDLATVWLKQ
jgi:peptide/nickel transport system substrate-binding protein